MSHREQREAAADRLREEFLRTLSEIDRRRHEVSQLPQRIAQHRGTLLGAAALGAAAFGVTLLVRSYLRHKRAQVLRHERGRLLLHAFQHPEEWTPEGLRPHHPWWKLLGKVAVVGAIAAGVPVGRVLAGRLTESQARPVLYN